MSKVEKSVPTERARQLIADATEKFLRTRMQMTQKIILSKGLATITLDDFTKGLNNATKNGGESKWKYYEDNIGKIAISNEEIEELVSLVRESITKYYNNNSAFSGNFCYFIDGTIKSLYESIDTNKLLNSEEKKAKLKIIEKWRNTYSSSYTSYGIDPRIDGTVDWGYSDEFSIANEKSRVCVIGFDGTEKLQSDIQVEELLLDNNLFVGVAYCRNSEGIMEEMLPVILLKVDDNKAKSVLGGRQFPIGKQGDNDEYVDLTLKFHDYLELKGMSYFKEELYDVETFCRIVLIHDKLNKLSDEKKEKISKVTDCAVDWWAKVISSSLKTTWLDEYCCECKEEVFDEDGNLIPEVKVYDSINDKPKYSHEEMEKFRFNLKNEISAELILHDKECRLYFVHGRACNIIDKAAAKAGLYKKWPLDRIECIYEAAIFVTCETIVIKPLNSSSEDIMIYDSNQDVKNK